VGLRFHNGLPLPSHQDPMADLHPVLLHQDLLLLLQPQIPLLRVRRAPRGVLSREPSSVRGPRNHLQTPKILLLPLVLVGADRQRLVFQARVRWGFLGLLPLLRATRPGPPLLLLAHWFDHFLLFHEEVVVRAQFLANDTSFFLLEGLGDLGRGVVRRHI